MSPIPSGEDLDKYNGVIDGGADRVMKLIEGQASHRQELEKKDVDADIWLRKTGLILAFIVAMVATGGGFWLIYEGKDVGALGPIFVAVATLTGVFVWWTRQKNQRPPQPPGTGAPG